MKQIEEAIVILKKHKQSLDEYQELGFDPDLVPIIKAVGFSITLAQDVLKEGKLAPGGNISLRVYAKNMRNERDKLEQENRDRIKYIQAFFEKVVKRNDCWIWTGATQQAKDKKLIYGRVWNGSTTELAHRFSYRVFVGEIPSGLTVDHQCGNTFCVNPKHLKAMTLKENILKGDGLTAINARKTHCKCGQKLVHRSTKPEKLGRYCRKCFQEYMKKYRKRSK